MVHIAGKKIVVFEKCKHPYVCGYAHDQEQFSSLSTGVFYKYARNIVYDDGEEKDQDINGHKRHVEKTTGSKQVEPAKPVGQQKIDNGNNWKK